MHGLSCHCKTHFRQSTNCVSCIVSCKQKYVKLTTTLLRFEKTLFHSLILDPFWFLVKISKDFQIFSDFCVWSFGDFLVLNSYSDKFFQKPPKFNFFCKKVTLLVTLMFFQILSLKSVRALLAFWLAQGSPDQILSLAEMSAQSSSRSQNWAAQVAGPSWPLARRSSSRSQNWAAQVSGPSWPLARRISNLNFSARFEYISPAFSFSESFCPLVSRVKEAPWSKEKFR